MGFAFADPNVLTEEQRAAMAEHARSAHADSRGISLQQMREEAELSQEELAGVLKLNVQRIARIESGGLDRVQLATLRRYAGALGAQLQVKIVNPNSHCEVGQN